jgi:hypothetical protein
MIMTIRWMALVLGGAAVLASVPVTTASAGPRAGAWRFVTQYRTLAKCKQAGNDHVARHVAREYKCENDYTEAGEPTLDLYVR